jgi:NADH:ubiquinone reductase (non-electrogenic)
MNADILIVGGGFSGFSCYQAIDRKKRQVHLLSNRNHFLFTPLLPLAAVGTVEVRSIVEPIHSFEKKKGEIIIGEAVDLWPEQNKLIVRFGPDQNEEIQYNTLVLAMGAVTATYKIPDVEKHCLFMKEMKDARALREKLLYQFERAAHLKDAERKKALNFVIVGAGATGVETACEIHDLIKKDLSKYLPELAQAAQIHIIEGTKDILSSFDRTLAEYAGRKLKQKGILVKTELAVKKIEAELLWLANGEIIESETIVWTAGIGPGHFTEKISEKLGIPLEKGRIPTEQDLRVTCGYSNIYGLGDCSLAKDEKGHMIPATAQVAMKEGIYLGQRLSGKTKAPFHFKSMGMLASLGTGSAIADLGFFQFKGVLAWWFWKAAYLTRLVSMRNKISVLFDWIKVRFFGRNTARIEF